MAFRLLGGNLLLLMPLGFILPIIRAPIRSVGRVAAVALLVSVTIELLQLVIIFTLGDVARAIDIDGVILRVSGTVLGWAIWRLLTALGAWVKDSGEALVPQWGRRELPRPKEPC